MKHALLAASLVLVAGGAVACGGGGGAGAPADASKTDFCDSYQSLFTDLAAMAKDGEPSDEDTLKAVKSWSAKIKDVGTPESIPDDAREGFELILDEVDDLDLKTLKATKLEDLGADISAADQKKAEAFTTYVTDNCGNPFDDAAPSDAPS